MNGKWQVDFSDHTHPGDTSRGYMFMVDASKIPDKLYEYKITGLCSNARNLYFSVRAANLTPKSQDAGKAPHEPMLRFELSDTAGNILATYLTSAIPCDEKGRVQWRSYGFPFDTKGNSSVILRIYNNMFESVENYFVLDDVEVRLCVPPIAMDNKQFETVCYGDTFTLKASYTDDGTFADAYNRLTYRWEYSENGSDWTTVGRDVVSSSTTIESSYTMENIEENIGGFYRFVVSRQFDINNRNCRAVSKVISLNVIKMRQVPDLRIMIAPAASQHEIYLTSFIDTVNATTVKWDNYSRLVPDFSDTESGALNAREFTANRVYTYKYSVSTQCGVKSAKAYVFTSPDRMPVNHKEIFVCRDLELSKYVQLNQILGLEDDGTWSYPDDTEKIVEKNITVSSPHYAGAKIFNAQKAYDEANNASYSIDGNPNAKRFKFQFKSSRNTTCEFAIVVYAG
jgi:hypothetical protein